MTTVLITFFVALFLGVPIVFVIGLATFMGIVMLQTYPLTVIPQKIFTGINMFSFMAIPFFILAGEIMNRGGITDKLVRFADYLVGKIPGGLAHTNIVSSMFFGGISGAAVADTSAIGSILIPAMRRAGYDRDYSAAVTAASSVIGPIIPPSIVMVTYAVTMDVSVGALFLAGIVPGVLIGFALMGLAYFYAIRYKHPQREESVTLAQLGGAILDALWALIMPIIIVGGILGGFFTPTEAAAVAVAYSFLVSMFVFRTLSLRDMPQILLHTASASSVVLIIIAMANALGWLIAVEQVTANVSNLFFNVSQNPLVLLLILNAILLVAGMFLDTAAAIILLAPILVPVLISAGVHPLHVGFIFVMNLVIGLATPPIGTCLFIACDIANTTLERLTKAIWPFILVEIAVLLLITYVPAVAMWLPGLFNLYN